MREMNHTASPEGSVSTVPGSLALWFYPLYEGPQSLFKGLGRGP